MEKNKPLNTDYFALSHIPAYFYKTKKKGVKTDWGLGARMSQMHWGNK